MDTQILSTLTIHQLTRAQYEREKEAGRIDETALYLTTDEEVDLSIYATVEQLAAKADSKHTHEVGDITGIQDVFNDKSTLIVQFTLEDYRWVCDKSFADVSEAIETGKYVISHWSTAEEPAGPRMPVTYSSATEIRFSCLYDIDGNTYHSVAGTLHEDETADIVIGAFLGLPDGSINPGNIGKILSVGSDGFIWIDAPVQAQPDWKETDETSPAYIHNKPSEADAFTLVVATGLIEPVTNEDDKVLTDENNKIIII